MQSKTLEQHPSPAHNPPKFFHRLKVTRVGEMYLDGKPVAESAFSAVGMQISQEGSGIIYYRESPEREPTQEAFAAFQNIVPVLKELRIPIQMGNQAAPEWGRLEGFQLEVAPSHFRFFLVRSQPFFFGLESDKGEMLVLSNKIPDEATWFQRVDRWISSDRLIETPMHAAEKFLRDETRKTPSLHVGAMYSSSNKRWAWQSWYLLDAVPSNIKSLLEDCRQFVLHVAGPREQWKTAARGALDKLFRK
jgi:hypothetical protein